ncbi:MAG: hypothetical protein ACRDOW_02485 [Nocardioidaceae bacterium]
MITVDRASRLRRAGLRWSPASGDRFNGTTGWALDSIAQDEVVRPPHEAQLRALLELLEASPGP